jgi:hypothetical protein
LLVRVSSLADTSTVSISLPTLCFFLCRVMKPGANNEGYWNLANVVIQLENTADCCAVMCPNVDFVASYDNSQNHRGKREGGLDIKSMNKGHGGAQPKMDSSQVPLSLMGPLFENEGVKLPQGALQVMTFEGEHVGPYWMTPRARLEKKFNQHTGQMKTRKMLKNELIQALTDGLTTPPENLDQKSRQSLNTLAERHGIPTMVQKEVVIKGWLGEPKGLAQILAERGLIDVRRPYGFYSKAQLQDLLGECEDFKNEISLLEWVAKKYGWTVIFSAKGYPDDAGFGIEYDWACSKNHISLTPLADRKGADKLRACFDVAFSDEILTKKVVRGCAKKARQYMLAYLAVHAEKGKLNLDGPLSIDDIRNCVDVVAYSKVEKMRKNFKTHRSVADINGSDVRMIVLSGATSN